MKQLAQLSFDNSMIEFQNTELSFASFVDPITPELILNFFVKYIFSPQGHSWFDKCDVIKRGNNLTIFGSHNLGPNFHIFVRHLLCLYLQLFQYELLKDWPSIEDLQSQAKEFDMSHVKREFYKFSITFTPKNRIKKNKKITNQKEEVN